MDGNQYPSITLITAPVLCFVGNLRLVKLESLGWFQVHLWPYTRLLYLLCKLTGNIVVSINPLWPSDAIWCLWSWSTLVQVMACCLTAPSHYQNQCWLIVDHTHRHNLPCNFNQMEIIFIEANVSENTVCKMFAFMFRPQCVRHNSCLILENLSPMDCTQAEFCQLI